MAARYFDVIPPSEVDVLVDDAWRAGMIRAWRKRGDDWLAFVVYTTEPGAQHLQWVEAERVRPTKPPPPQAPR